MSFCCFLRGPVWYTQNCLIYALPSIHLLRKTRCVFFPLPLAQWSVRKLKDVSRCHLSLNVCSCRYLEPLPNAAETSVKDTGCAKLLQPGCVTHSSASTALQALIINFRAYIKKKAQTWTSSWEEEQKYSSLLGGEREDFHISPPPPATHFISHCL